MSETLGTVNFAEHSCAHLACGVCRLPDRDGKGRGKALPGGHMIGLFWARPSIAKGQSTEKVQYVKCH